MYHNTRLIAFDLDGTLTQHRTPLPSKTRTLLDRLRTQYQLLIIGAGACQRIFRQTGEYPIDIIGNYGMQYARYDETAKHQVLEEDLVVSVDKALTEQRADALRKQFGWLSFAGDPVEFHGSGMITFPLLGTQAKIEDKLAFDPDRQKRKPMLAAVRQAFPEYTVFLGGSSSFDIVPKPFDKQNALERHCARLGLSLEQVVYVGDDYGEGGNDEAVFLSSTPTIPVDDYRTVEACLFPLLKNV